MTTPSTDLVACAADHVVSCQFGSTAMLQRKLGIGQSRAHALMSVLEENGIVGPAREGRLRDVLARPDQLTEILAGLPSEEDK